MNIKSINWKVFSILFIASIIGLLAVMPYAFTIQADLLKEVSFPLPILAAISILQSAVLFFIITLGGMVLSKKIGFGTPILDQCVVEKKIPSEIKSILGISILSGMVASVLIILGDYIFSLFNTISISDTVFAPAWQGILASLYGGINEELLLRFFFMSLLIFMFMKIRRKSEKSPTISMIWIAIIFASIIFGLAHLPFTTALTTITPLIIARAVILNSIGGIIFGWLYWKKGLESAMISHFSADIVLHGMLPLIILM